MDQQQDGGLAVAAEDDALGSISLVVVGDPTLAASQLPGRAQPGTCRSLFTTRNVRPNRDTMNVGRRVNRSKTNDSQYSAESDASLSSINNSGGIVCLTGGCWNSRRACM